MISNERYTKGGGPAGTTIATKKQKMRASWRKKEGSCASHCEEQQRRCFELAGRVPGNSLRGSKWERETVEWRDRLHSSFMWGVTQQRVRDHAHSTVMKSLNSSTMRAFDDMAQVQRETMRGKHTPRRCHSYGTSRPLL
eukprot:6190780-Pleurochrysis_carterae.AAC.2